MMRTVTRRVRQQVQKGVPQKATRGKTEQNLFVSEEGKKKNSLRKKTIPKSSADVTQERLCTVRLKRPPLYTNLEK